MANLSSMLFHFEQWFKPFPNNQKRAIYERYSRYSKKYSGNRGNSYIVKMKFIQEKYPEALI